MRIRYLLQEWLVVGRTCIPSIDRPVDAVLAAYASRQAGLLGSTSFTSLLRQAGYLADLPFERRRDRAGDGLRIGSR